MSNLTPQKNNRRVDEFMKYLKDIDDPMDKNETFNKLSTNLQWNENNENELISRQKIIKKYLTGFTKNNLYLSSVDYIADMITPHLPTKDLQLLLTFDSKEALKIALNNVNLTKIDSQTFSKTFLCTDSCSLFSALFWYLFITYFKSQFLFKPLIKLLLSELSKNYIKLKYNPLMKNLINYKGENIKITKRNKIKKIHNKTYTDYFLDSYPFIIGEAIYICLIRHFCYDEWIINYQIRNRIINDIFYLLNGIKISHISIEKHLTLLYPNGTLVPPPILWRKCTINYNLRTATTPRTNNRRAATVVAGNRNNNNKLLKSFVLESQKSGKTNPDNVRSRNRLLSTAPNISSHLIDINKNKKSNKKKYPLQRWLNKQMFFKNKKYEKPRKKIFVSRKMSPLFHQILGSKGMKKGQQFAMYEIPSFSCVTDTIECFVDNELDKRVTNITNQYVNIRKKIYHSLGPSNTKQMNIKNIKNIKDTESNTIKNNISNNSNNDTPQQIDKFDSSLFE